jgi:hypothetical protein
MSRVIDWMRATDMSERARHRDRLLRVAAWHYKAAHDFAEAGDRASAVANIRLAEQAEQAAFGGVA